MANGITCIRIICSLTLLFCQDLSVPFYSLYIIAARFSDMIDGAVVGKTGTVSDFDYKLDIVADFILDVVCLIKLMSALETPQGYVLIAGNESWEQGCKLREVLRPQTTKLRYKLRDFIENFIQKNTKECHLLMII